jgi:pimeloyl-ACP methyl ester carboxylesterase
MNDSRITLSDGRGLAFSEIGDAGGAPVFYFHGAPSSRLSLVPLEMEFADRGIRVVSPDRPGYGGSSPQPGRTMSDWPVDVAELANALGIDRFIVAGQSSGGPYAVACAALLPNRVSGAVVLAGITDMAWPEAWNSLFEAEIAMMRMPDEQSATARCVELFGADGSKLLGSSWIELPKPDMALFSDENMADAMLASITEAFRQGVGGYAQDIFVQGRAWPFAPGSIATPAMLVHGELDTIIPVAHSRHTAGLIPGSSLRILPKHGHISIASELPGLCAQLIQSLS